MKQDGSRTEAGHGATSHATSGARSGRVGRQMWADAGIDGHQTGHEDNPCWTVDLL